jgi:ribosomal protein L29
MLPDCLQYSHTEINCFRFFIAFLQRNVARLFTVLPYKDQLFQILYSILLQRNVARLFTVLPYRDQLFQILNSILPERNVARLFTVLSYRDNCLQIVYSTYSLTEQCSHIVCRTLLQWAILPDFNSTLAAESFVARLFTEKWYRIAYSTRLQKACCHNLRCFPVQ